MFKDFPLDVDALFGGQEVIVVRIVFCVLLCKEMVVTFASVHHETGQRGQYARIEGLGGVSVVYVVNESAGVSMLAAAKPIR